MVNPHKKGFVMNIVDSVEKEIRKNNNAESQSRHNYQEAMVKYQKLLDDGIAVKRESRLQSISDLPAVAYMH